jgi:hypothetical protein
MPPGLSKGGKEEEGLLHCFTRILLDMREREERNNHTTRACNLSELVGTRPVRVSFIRRASGLFIAPSGRRDNYKKELKKGEMKCIQCSQSKNSFPVKVSDRAIGRHAVMCFPKFRGWL